MKRDKAAYLEMIDKYAQIIADLPDMLDNSADTIYEIAQKIEISYSALSNKKHGRRDWKYEEVENLISLLCTDNQKEVVKNYMLIVNDILPIIQENGIRFGFVFEKAGLTVGQYQVRNRSIAAWNVSEVRRIIDVLKF